MKQSFRASLLHHGFLYDSSVCRLRMKRRAFTKMLNKYLNLKLALSLSSKASLSMDSFNFRAHKLHSFSGLSRISRMQRF